MENVIKYLGFRPVYKDYMLESEIKLLNEFDEFEFHGFVVSPLNYPLVCGFIQTHFKNFVRDLCDELNERNVEIRVCDECGNFMVEGYCIDGGLKYYCKDDCLHKYMTPEEWNEIYDEGGENYWTEWEAEGPVYDGPINITEIPFVGGFSFNGYEVTPYNFSEVRSIISELFDYQLRDFVQCVKEELRIICDE